MKKLVISAAMIVFSGMAFAQSNDALPKTNSLPQAKTAQERTQPPAGNNPEIDAAIKACAANATKDSSGHPDRTAMDTCMKSKGFNPPDGRGEHKGPPPDNRT